MDNTLALIAVAVLNQLFVYLRLRGAKRREVLTSEALDYLRSVGWDTPKAGTPTPPAEPTGVSLPSVLVSGDHFVATSPSGRDVTVAVETVAKLLDQTSTQEVFNALSERLRHALQPASRFDIKTHGTSVLPLVVPSLLIKLLARPQDVVTQPLDGSPLSLLYVLDSTGDLNYLTDDHLHEMSIDRRDLFGIGFAVLRQRLPELPSLQPGSQPELLQVAAEDRFAASHLITLDETLQGDDQLFARVLSSNQLWVASSQESLQALRNQHNGTPQQLAQSISIRLPTTDFVITPTGPGFVSELAGTS